MICEPQLSTVLPGVLDGVFHYVETSPCGKPVEAIVRIVRDDSTEACEAFELQVVRMFGDSWFKVGSTFEVSWTKTPYPRKRLWTLTPFQLILWPEKAA